MRDIYSAIRNNSIEEIKAALEENPEAINQNQGFENGTPFYYAAQLGKAKIMKFLFNQSDRKVIHEQNMWGLLPLHAAIESGSEKAVEFILENGGKEDIHKRAELMKTPLEYAIKSGNIDILRLILNNGGKEDINLLNDYFGTPMHYAAYIGDLDIIKLIFDTGGKEDINRVDKNGRTPMHSVSSTIIRDLDAYPVIDKNAAIEFIYTNGGNKDINKIDMKGKTPLHCVAKSSNLNDVKSIFYKGDKENINLLDIYGRNPMHRAIEIGRVNILEFLFNNLAEKNIYRSDNAGNTLTNVAAIYGRIEALEFILKITNEKDLDTKDNNGKTPLTNCIENYQNASVGCLMFREFIKTVKDSNLLSQNTDHTIKKLFEKIILDESLLNVPLSDMEHLLEANTGIVDFDKILEVRYVKGYLYECIKIQERRQEAESKFILEMENFLDKYCISNDRKEHLMAKLNRFENSSTENASEEIPNTFHVDRFTSKKVLNNQDDREKPQKSFVNLVSTKNTESLSLG